MGKTAARRILNQDLPDLQEGQEGFLCVSTDYPVFFSQTTISLAKPLPARP
jgi:hypothetical protein